jgi:hypothetical protein
MKKASGEGSTVLTVRVPKRLDRKLMREARRLRQTRSKTACALLESALQWDDDEDPASEARRQSRLASQRASEREALTFIAEFSDLQGWE